MSKLRDLFETIVEAVAEFLDEASEAPAPPAAGAVAPRATVGTYVAPERSERGMRLRWVPDGSPVTPGWRKTGRRREGPGAVPYQRV